MGPVMWIRRSQPSRTGGFCEGASGGSSISDVGKNVGRPRFWRIRNRPVQELTWKVSKKTEAVGPKAFGFFL